MKRNQQYKLIPGLSPGRSVFDLSNEYFASCDMGQLIPVRCDDVVPGAFYDMSVNAVIRMMPLVSPVLSRIDVYFHSFFVPYRLLWSDWEDFITGGIDGNDSSSLPTMSGAGQGVGTLWDYLGFPVGVSFTGDDAPVRFPRSAYSQIWNDWYRDETLQTELNIDTNVALKLRNFSKDRFTSALPWQQRGTTPALPVTITGSTSAVWEGSSFTSGTVANSWAPGTGGDYIVSNASGVRDNALATFNDNTVAGSGFTASSFDVSDLRLSFQIQKWMERNARGGARYTESLQMHYGLKSQDSRLQRAEYIGGARSPLIVSEVLQTSETGTTPQGSLAGHGITLTSGQLGKYRVPEHGVIMTLMSIMPKVAYSQGVNKMWLKQSRYDFVWPEFSRLSQTIFRWPPYNVYWP